MLSIDRTDTMWEVTMKSFAISLHVSSSSSDAKTSLHIAAQRILHIFFTIMLTVVVPILNMKCKFLYVSPEPKNLKKLKVVLNLNFFR